MYILEHNTVRGVLGERTNILIFRNWLLDVYCVHMAEIFSMKVSKNLCGPTKLYCNNFYMFYIII